MEKIYKPKDVAKLLGITTKTLINWDKSGKLKAYRTPTDRRYYKQHQLNELIGDDKREIIINQDTSVEELCYIVEEVLNNKINRLIIDKGNKNFNNLIELLCNKHECEVIKI